MRLRCRRAHESARCPPRTTVRPLYGGALKHNVDTGGLTPVFHASIGVNSDHADEGPAGGTLPCPGHPGKGQDEGARGAGLCRVCARSPRGEPGCRVAVLAAPDVLTIVATGTLASMSSDPPALAPVQVASSVDARFVDDDDAGAGGSDDGPRDRDLARYRVVEITSGGGPDGADADPIPPEASSLSSAFALRDGRRVVVVHVLRLRAADLHGDRQAPAASEPLAPTERILTDRPHGASKHRSQHPALKHFGRFL